MSVLKHNSSDLFDLIRTTGVENEWVICIDQSAVEIRKEFQGVLNGIKIISCLITLIV